MVHSNVERDYPLSFFWDILDADPLEVLGIGKDMPPARRRAMRSIITHLYVVGRAEPERFISYRGNRNAYASAKRYFSRCYTPASAASVRQPLTRASPTATLDLSIQLGRAVGPRE